MHTVCVVSLLSLVSADPNTAVGLSSAPTREELELAKQQLQKMKESRERLASGIFRATGREVRIAHVGWPKADLPMNFFCAFDYRADLFRFDRDVASLWYNPKSKDPPKNWHYKGIYIRTPEYSLHWTNAQPDLVKRLGTGAKPPADATPFDVRLLGLAFELTRYCAFRDAYRATSESKILEVANEGKSVCRIVGEREPGTFVTTWIDGEQGHSAIRVEVRLRRRLATPLQRAETTWQQVSGIWVPRTFFSQFFLEDGKLESKTHVAFDWQSVNQPVPGKLFTPSGMGLPQGTWLEDR